MAQQIRPKGPGDAHMAELQRKGPEQVRREKEARHHNLAVERERRRMGNALIGQQKRAERKAELQSIKREAIAKGPIDPKTGRTMDPAVRQQIESRLQQQSVSNSPGHGELNGKTTKPKPKPRRSSSAAGHAAAKSSKRSAPKQATTAKRRRR